MRQDECGYIVVETTLAFTLLVLLLTSILVLIQIVTMQARIHYALTQTAQTISMYSYVLDLTGISDRVANLQSQGEGAADRVASFKNNLNDILNGLDSLDYEKMSGGIQGAYGQIGEALQDPKETLRQLAVLGVNELKNAATANLLIEPLMAHYLSNGTQSADEYLKSVGVEGGMSGLSFYQFDLLSMNNYGQQDSYILDAEGNIRLVARYRVSYVFGNLPLPFDGLEICQTVKTKAWLAGSGSGYWK